jgi:hypothetical protein
VPVGQRRCLHVHRLRARSEAFNDMVRKLHAGSKVLPSTPAFLPVWSPKRVNGDTEWISPPHLDHGQPRTNTFHHPENCSPATTKTTAHSVSARSRGVGLWASQAVADFSRRETYGFLRYRERRGVEHTTVALCPRGVANVRPQASLSGFRTGRWSTAAPRSSCSAGWARSGGGWAELDEQIPSRASRNHTLPRMRRSREGVAGRAAEHPSKKQVVHYSCVEPCRAVGSAVVAGNTGRSHSGA